MTVRVLGSLLSRRERKVWEDTPGRSILSYLPEGLRGDDRLKILRSGVLISAEEAALSIAGGGEELTFYRLPEGLPPLAVLGIGLLISGILAGVSRALAPSVRPLNRDLETSATYGWDGIKNTVKPGTPIPLVYGRHRIGGHIISQFQREARETPADGDPRAGELHTLIALCAGPIQSVDSIRINGNPATDFSSAVTTDYRTGELYQAPLEGFRDAVTQYTQDRELTNVAGAIQMTTSDAIDAFEIVLRFPAGLYKLSDKGQYNAKSVELRIGYREVGADAWTYLAPRTISQKTQSVFDAFLASPRLRRARYEIQVVRNTPDDTTATGASQTTILALNEIVDETLAYPRIALLAVRQLPTNQVSGSAPAYDALVTGRRVRVYTSETEYTVEWSDNPAWVAVDYMTDPFQGLGAWIKEGDILIDTFLEWADFCDELVAEDERGTLEKRFTFNGVIDGSLSAFDVLSQIVTTGRANLFLRGDKWGVRIEREEEPVQFFQMSRIHKGQFSVTKRTRNLLANVFNGQFWNAETDYEEDLLPWPDPTLTEGDEQREEPVNLLGTTSASQAKRLLNYIMLSNRLLRRDVDLEVGAEAIGMEAGDVFKCAHDVPGWGMSGRIQSVDETGTVLFLDRDFTIEAGKSYELTVIHRATDVIDVLGVTSLPGTSNRILVSGDWSSPPEARLDYSIGEVSQSTVLLRCLGISKSSDPTKRVIRARQYDPAVYGEDLSVLPAPSPSRLPDPLRLPADCRDLRLVERQVYAEDGTLSTALDVHFTLPVEPGIRALVYWRRQGDGYWEPVALVSTGYASITRDVESPGATYEVSVVSVSATGNRKSPDAGLRGTISTVGTTRQPGNVGGFVVDRTLEGLVFRWLPLDPVAYFDLAYYEIRDGASWDTATVVGRTDGTTLETSIFVAGVRTFLIKGVNTAGKASPIAAAVVLDVDPRIGENVILTRQEETSWTGSKEGFVIDGDDLLLDTEADIVAWRAAPSPPPAFSGLIPGGFGAAFRVSGIYTTEIFQVASEAVRSLVAVDAVIDQIDTSLYWDAPALAGEIWDGDFARSRAWAVAPDGRVETVIEMRFSTTTADDGAFGPWQERPQNIEVLAKWAQVRVRATVRDPRYTVRIQRLRIFFDVPDVTDSGLVTTSTLGTEAVVFAKEFLSVPRVAVSVLSAQAGDEVNFENVDADGFDVEVKNSGSRVARTVHWLAHGY